MDFERDENKRLSTIEKHGLDFLDAETLFQNNHLAGQARSAGEEVRILAIGLINGNYVTIVFTKRPGTIRVITMRRARENERRQHQTLFGGGASGPT